MGIPSIGAGSIGAQFGSSAGGGSRESIESKLTQLEKQRDEYEKKLAYEPSLKNKIDSLNNRIETLKTRLEKAKQDDGECQTCKNRKYRDDSDDPGVSFKTATKVDPRQSGAAVRGHENEHVYRNQAKAAREDKEIISQSVTIKNAVCPECGKPYAAGGETKTVTRAKKDDRFGVGLSDNTKTGEFFDTVA